MCSIKNKTKWYAAIVMAAASLALAPAANGVVTYAFDQPNYQALPGATVSVPVYLNFGPADVSVLTAGNGLATAGAYIATLNAPASPALLSGLRGEPSQFDGYVLMPDGNDFEMKPPGAFIPASSGRLFVLANTPSGGAAVTGSRVLLGHLDFHAGAVAGQTTTFSATMVDSADYIASTAGGYPDIDPVAFNAIAPATVSLTVVSVPEPGLSLSLVVLTSAALLMRDRRSGRQLPAPK